MAAGTTATRSIYSVPAKPTKPSAKPKAKPKARRRPHNPKGDRVFQIALSLDGTSILLDVFDKLEGLPADQAEVVNAIYNDLCIQMET